MKRAVLLLVLVSLTTVLQAAIYPMEAGDLRRSGQAQGISHAALPMDLVWSANFCASEPRSNPIVLSDRIVQTYLTGIVCASRYDGTVLWRAGAMGALWNPPAYDPDRDLLYQATTNGVMSALRPSDGSEAWHYYEGQAQGCANLASCTYWQDKIYIGTATGKVVCLDAETHAVLWSRNIGAASGIGTPALDNDELYVGTLTGYLYCLNANTGAILWQKYSSRTTYASAVSLDDTRMYMMTSLGRVECRLRSNGNLLWTFQTGSWTLANLSVGPRGLYCTSDDRCIYRLDEATGGLIWQTCFQGNFARSSPFCAGDMVVASGCTGSYYGVDASTGTGVWDLYHDAWNSFADFAEADGLLFVTDLYGIMYCLRPQNSPFPPTVTTSPTRTSSPSPSITATPTDSPTATATATATSTSSATASSTSTSTPSFTATPTASPTATGTITASPSSSATPSKTATATFSVTPSASPTGTPTSTATPSATASASPTLSTTQSATPSVSPTGTYTTVATQTQVRTADDGRRDPGEDRCYVAPNPVHGGPCRVVYRMKAPGTCKVRVFQASGDPVGFIEDYHSTAGVHSSEISTQRYAPGVYFCRTDLKYDQGGEDKLPLTKFLVLKAK